MPLWDQINRSLYPEFGDSISVWNSSPTAAYFSSGSSSNYLVNAADAYYGNTGWDGYGGVHGFCGNATDGFALLNDSTLPGKDYSYRRHTEAHELGHALTLDHADGYVAVMSTTDTSYYSPQQHDIDDMNARYPWP
ncbi:MAG: hypothetical protein HYX56_05585 [Chloroflexi bacterium]|nr:hypothetical protein [Chloroflexota bacterium]